MQTLPGASIVVVKRHPSAAVVPKSDPEEAICDDVQEVSLNTRKSRHNLKRDSSEQHGGSHHEFKILTNGWPWIMASSQSS